MRITELNITADAEKVSITWKLSEGEQNSFDLFLIQNGYVVKRVRSKSTVTEYTFCTAVFSMREYLLLLTVRCKDQLSSARTAFLIEKGHKLNQSTLFYTEHK